MAGIPAGAGALLGKRLGKYDILALLALGGTAEIYLARIGGTAGFEKYVVVKCLHDHLVDDPDFVRMFLDEARLAALLDHSNIVQTFELGEHEGRYYMVMEFLAGLSLAMVVRRAAERLPGGRLPVPLVLNACAQACAGLQYAHERTNGGRALNIVHRDMSPQNLVVSFEGVVKVVDFGIAKAEMRETRTRSGTIKGKFAYMSPEQCVANNVDRRTDVFALGVILHELLTGRRLFKRPSPYDTYQAVIECNVAPPSQLNHELDPSLDPIVLRALAKDKEDRFETAEAFGDALMGYLHHRGKGSGPGELARFFDLHFTQELEEHSTRMRELISGREIAVDGGASWDEELEAREAAEEAARAAERKTELAGEIGNSPSAATSGEINAAAVLAAAAPGELSEIIADLDELPSDRTRIEDNPLEGAPTVRPGQMSVADLADWVGDLASSPNVPALPPSDPGGPGGRGRPASAPTMLASPLEVSGGAPRSAPGLPPAAPASVQVASLLDEAPTQLAAAVEAPRPPLMASPHGPGGQAPPGAHPAPGTPRAMPGDPNGMNGSNGVNLRNPGESGPAGSPYPRQQLDGPGQPMQGPQGQPPMQGQPMQGQPPMQGPQGQPMQGQPPMQGPQGQPPMQGPQGQPPMQGPQGQPMQGQPPMQGPQGQPPMQGPQGQPPMQGPQGQPPMHGQPMQGPPMQRPLGPGQPGGPGPMHPGGDGRNYPPHQQGAGPQHVMSPVGPGFADVNWDAMAARRAKAVPWWLLTLMFVLVVSLALGLTFALSKVF